MIGTTPADSEIAPSPPYSLACSAARGGEPTVVTTGDRRIGGEYFARFAARMEQAAALSGKHLGVAVR